MNIIIVILSAIFTAYHVVGTIYRNPISAIIEQAKKYGNPPRHTIALCTLTVGIEISLLIILAIRLIIIGQPLVLLLVIALAIYHAGLLDRIEAIIGENIIQRVSEACGVITYSASIFVLLG